MATKPVRVSGDTDMPMTDAERKTWHDTALGLHELQRVANDAAEAVTALGTQVTALEALVKSAASVPAEGKSALGEAGKTLADLRRRLGVGQGGPGGGGFGGQQNTRGQIGQNKGQIMGSTSAPTVQQVRIAGELRADMETVVQEVNAAIAAVSSLYDKLGAAGVKPAAPKPIGLLPAAR